MFQNIFPGDSDYGYSKMHDSCFTSTIVESLDSLDNEAKAMKKVGVILDTLGNSKQKKRVLKHLFDILND